MHVNWLKHPKLPKKNNISVEQDPIVLDLMTKFGSQSYNKFISLEFGYEDKSNILKQIKLRIFFKIYFFILLH